MKIAIVDISGKVIKYDIALCDAINQFAPRDTHIEYYCPLYEERPNCKTIRLFNLIPSRYKNSENIIKRIIKLFEVLINYIIVVWNVYRKTPDILHFQWFPLLEITSIESIFVSMIKRASPNTKLLLTIHNVYPHGFTDNKKEQYIIRFNKIAELVDGFIVHTKRTKDEVCADFKVNCNRVFVIHHGIFIPEGYEPHTNKFNEGCVNFIIFGNLSKYKGIDIFIDAIKQLPVECQNRMHAVIAGEIQDKALCEKLQQECSGLNVEWFTYFLPEKELYERIEAANVIVLPYRQISQSGVLLLALSFRRLVLTSDLPSFKETLQGFSEDMFFETGNPKGLAQLMMRYIDGKVDAEKQMRAIERLNHEYSWEKAAEMTINAYKQTI